PRLGDANSRRAFLGLRELGFFLELEERCSAHRVEHVVIERGEEAIAVLAGEPAHPRTEPDGHLDVLGHVFVRWVGARRDRHDDEAHRAAPAPPLDAGVVIAAASVVLYGGRPLEAELRELLREREADEIRAALELLAAHAPDRGRRFDVPGVDLRARVEQIEEHGQALARGERRRELPGTKTDA